MTPVKCRNCLFRNCFLVTNVYYTPIGNDEDECGAYGCAPCSKAIKNCRSYCPPKKTIVQLSFNF